LRKFLHSTWVFLFVLCLWGPLANGEEPKGPKLVLKEPSFDFGAVKEGEVIEHAFKVLNEGDQVLEIQDVKPG
jgi:hypothetical protein